MSKLVRKIFITGAAGFIATHLIRRLSQDTYECWGCDIVPSENDRIRRIDVADFAGLERLIQIVNPNIVVHMANYGNRYPDQYSHSTLWQTNVIGTENVLELQRRFGFDLVYTSSSEVYGTNAPTPVHEHHEGDYWYNDYAFSKWISEKLMQRQAGEYPHLRSMILRLFGIYGPGQPHTKDNSVVSQFINKIGNGQPIEIHDCERCFLYVEDCTEAIVQAIDKVFYTEQLRPYNIGSTERVTIRGLARLIEEILQVPMIESDKNKVLVGVSEKEPSIAAAANDLKWGPRTSLFDGLRQTISDVRPSITGKPFGLFIDVDGEKKIPRQLSCAERIVGEEVLTG